MKRIEVTKVYKVYEELSGWKGLCLDKIIDGLKYLRQDYEEQIFLEVVLLAGINEMEKEWEGLKTVIDNINPEKIQLNTVVFRLSDKRVM